MAPPPASKSRETKKEAMNKTARRKAPKAAGTVKKAAPPKTNVAMEGMKPEDMLDHLQKAGKNRAGTFDMMKAASAFLCPDCVIPKFLPNNPRLPVPITDKRLASAGPGEDYLPSQLVSLECNEYVFVQAPNKCHVPQLWKYICKDNIRVVIALCTDEQMSATDDSKCYTYFPTEPEQAMEMEQKKGKHTMKCKAREGLSMGAMKYDMELLDSETVVEKISDDPGAPTVLKPHLFTLYHMNTWTGVRSETGIAVDQVENVASFLRMVHEAESVIIRQTMDNYQPPVLLQSFDGVGRAAIAWVILMLLKDWEKRECFDVPDLVRKIMKSRPGAISNYYHYAFTYAVAFQIGKITKWCANDCTTALDELIAKFPGRKLNEVGNLLPV